MLIVRTPFRMSFFGGGTDYKEYYEQYGGSVISATFDKYCYLTIRNLPPFFEYKNQLTYSKIERFNDVDEVEHPLVREALRYMKTQNVQISYDADLPARSGIGSSSSFAVALLQGLHALKEEYPDKMTLAKEAIHLERNLCAEAGGVQDQVAVSFGGLNRLDFLCDGFSVTPLSLSAERQNELNSNLLLLFTGFTHFSGIVAKEQQNNISKKLSQLHEMKRLVDEGEKILKHGDIDDFGRLLDFTWKYKKTLSEKITTTEIDEIYNRALSAGALGGKLLGAGGGGFMLLYVTPDKKEKVLKELDMFRSIPFSFESEGTKIFYKGSERE